MTTIENNKEIVREFIDRVFTKGDLTAVDELLTEDFVNHDPHFGAPEGREAFHISGHTVQEHLRAVFDEFGIGSRRALVAALPSPR